MSLKGVKTVSHAGVKMDRCNTPACATSIEQVNDNFITEAGQKERKKDRFK